MRKVLICLVSFVVLLQITGCYVRFQENEESEHYHYVGKQVETKGDLRFPADLPFYFKPPVAFPADRFSDRKKSVIVPAGTRLEITGISSRRIESGKWHYLEFLYETGEEKIIFDYPLSKRYLEVLNFDIDQATGN